MQNPSTLQQNERHRLKTRGLRAAVLGCGALAVSALLAGCSGALSPSTDTAVGKTGTLTYAGKVFGGQQPVSNATIQLWTVGTTGNRSASTALIASTVQSDANGNFNITGTYNCTSATQVYITATGGNPGSGTNSSIAMGTALGACTSLSASTFILINEVTTVAAAYALAPFAADYTHIGSAGSNPSGLLNAFANAALLANSATGTAGGAVPAGVTVPTAEINTLGNIIAACVNTTGAASAQCSQLFTATGATNTFNAALFIASQPSFPAVVSLYGLNSATAPFQPSLPSQPKDFSVAVSMAGTGSTLSTPYAVAIDASGNAFVTNASSNAVTEFGPTGTLVANTTNAAFYGAQGIAVARDNSVWVAGTASGAVSRCTPVNGLVGSAIGGCVTASSLAGPSSVALDSGSRAWVSMYNGNNVMEFSTAVASLGSFTGNSNITVPTGVAIALDGSVFSTSGNGTVVKLSNSGAYVSSFTDNALQGPQALAIDSTYRMTVVGYTTGAAVAGAVSEFDNVLSTTTASAVSPVASGVSSPAGVASDGTSFWVTNGGASGGLAQLGYGSAAAGSPTGGFGSLNAPVGVAVDSSGSVWTANSGSNTVSKFIGLALPVTTPLAANVGP